jgi:hypothetical protein
VCVLVCVVAWAQYGPGLSFLGLSSSKNPLLPCLRPTQPTLMSPHAPLHLGSPMGLHNSLFYRSGGDHPGGTNVTLSHPEFPPGLAELSCASKNVRAQVYQVFEKSEKEKVTRQQHWNLGSLSSSGSRARSLVCKHE